MTARWEAWLELSRERDVQLRLRDAAYREGWADCELYLGDRYEAGYADGVLALKRAQHDLHRLTAEDGRRWTVRGERRSRATFGQPHPGDYTGGPVAVR